MYFEKLKFKVRFIKFYILFGLFGLVTEFTVRNLILLIFKNDFFATIFGIIFGILFAYWANIKFNFQIPKFRLKKALILFFIIGVLSKLSQSFLANIIRIDDFSYEVQRIITSSILFILFYFINVQYTFSNRTKIGIAIYANNIEDIDKIYSKVLNFPDFIQIDLVDKTEYKNASPVDLKKINAVKQKWPDKFIELHLMTKNLKVWEDELYKLLSYLDLIIFNSNCFKDDLKIIQKIKSKKPSIKIGVYVSNSSNIDVIKELSVMCDQITIMGIKNVGFSGQQFLDSTLDLIREIDNFKNRNTFELEIDGGINSTNYYRLKVDKLVSASSVLNSDNSFKKVLEFKKL